jgi:hypothetical protein
MWLKFISLFLMCSCISVYNNKIKSFNDKNIVIQTFDLADQSTNKLLRGSWVIRRKRLEILNSTFNHNPPYIVFFQNSMNVIGSDVDSDHNIFLNYGLRWHKSYMQKVSSSSLSEEFEYSGLFIRESAKVKVVRDHSYWKLNEDGYLVHYDLIVEGERTQFFNIKMSSSGNVIDQLDLISSLIRGSFDLHNSCRRLVIGGVFKVDTDSLPYLRFLDSLDLVDTYSFCSQNKNCSTLYKSNPFSDMLTKGLEKVFSDRILVSKGTYIHKSYALDFEKKELNSYLRSKYNLQYLYPSVRKGWSAKVDLPVCR